MNIIDVWQENLNQIKTKINSVIKKYPYVAMDTEFPGIVAHPVIQPGKLTDLPYKILKLNVDLLNIIQIGFTFSTKEGSVDEENGCWQFNFFFDLNKDLFAQDSLDLLLRSGVDFRAHEKKGIGSKDFAKFLITSGLTLNKNIKWISFHSGYDFGYLIKILTNTNLPENRLEFLSLLNLYFPCSFDVKHISYIFKGFDGGLNKLAEELKIQRFGKVHQAGSDSLLTLEVFFKLREYFPCKAFEKKFQGILYGLKTNEKTYQEIDGLLLENLARD